MQKRRYRSGSSIKERHASSIKERHALSASEKEKGSIIKDENLPTLACPRHADKNKDSSEECVECNLLHQSQPEGESSSKSPKLEKRPISKKPAVFRKGKRKFLTLRSRRNLQKKVTPTKPLSVIVPESPSPRSRTKLMAASLPNAEVVISPLQGYPRLSPKGKQSLQDQTGNSSEVSDDDQDDSVIRNVCSESEPLPLEHCKRKLVQDGLLSPGARNKKRGSMSPGVAAGRKDLKRSSTGGDEAQPPRKRYQRVGLFSDFYKIE